MIQIGDKAPDCALRTDDGTSISLFDLKGRALSVFLVGREVPATVNSLLTALTEQTERFLALEVSPMVVLSDPEAQLGANPGATNPYLIAVDAELSLHKQFQGVDGKELGVFILDEDSVVIDVIPVLPPLELVRLAVERVVRLHHQGNGKENENLV
jgi:peroxiredoxin